jgi:hypothetical protein
VAGRSTVQIPTSPDGLKAIVGLNASMNRLGEFDGMRDLRLMAERLRPAWDGVTSNTVASVESRGRPYVWERSMLRANADQIIEVLEYAVTIEACCKAVHDSVQQNWPDVYQRMTTPRRRGPTT